MSSYKYKSYSKVALDTIADAPKVHHETNYTSTKHMFPRPELFALLICFSGSVVAFLVSYLVPPEGFDCRHVAQVLILTVWLLSAGIDLILYYILSTDDKNFLRHFWLTFCKDLISTLATVVGVMIAHVGVFNRCACYTNWGRTGLALPEMPAVKAVLATRIRTTYPGITFAGIIFQLVFVPVYIFVTIRHAVRVFLQRDHGDSGASRIWNISFRTPRTPRTPIVVVSDTSSADPSGTNDGGRVEATIAERLRRPRTFQRLNSDDIALAEYPLRS